MDKNIAIKIIDDYVSRIELHHVQLTADNRVVLRADTRSLLGEHTIFSIDRPKDHAIWFRSPEAKEEIRKVLLNHYGITE